jgi:hypothetical protein
MRRAGEPEPGLIEACRAAVRFIGDTLQVPLDRMKDASDPERARRVHGFVRSFRVGLINAAAGLWSPPFGENANLDIVAVAAVAIESLAGLGPPRNEESDGAEEIVDVLLSIAAGRRAEVASLAPQATDALARLATAAGPGEKDTGRAYRDGLRQTLYRNANEPGKLRYATVARDVLAQAGIGEESEVPAVRVLVDAALQSFDNEPDPDELGGAGFIFIIKRLPAATKDPALRKQVEAATAQAIDTIRRRIENFAGSPGDHRFLKAYGAP